MNRDELLEFIFEEIRDELRDFLGKWLVRKIREDEDFRKIVMKGGTSH